VVGVKLQDNLGYLRKLVDAKIVYPDEKPRNRKYYFYDLISILR
jgi:hypothetical protein